MRRLTNKLVYVPLSVFLIIFAIIPAVGMLIASFQGDSGSFSLVNYHDSFRGQYLRSFVTTTKLALFSGIIGIAFGTLVAWGTVRLKQEWIKKLVTSISSIMANFAGLPLAVAFMVTMGTTGLLTVVVSDLVHVPVVDLGWNLASFNGLLVIYTSFQIPLAVVLLLPAFSSLQNEWEEAVYSLGATLRTYVVRIVSPIMFPSIVGTLALLFANAFSAYVTAFAIAGGTVNLLPIQIGYLIDGNLTMNLGLGDALAIEEMVVLGVAVVVFLLTQRIQVQGRGQRGQANGA